VALSPARKGGLILGLLAAGYWLAARPRHLRWGATDADVARRWPGDELVDRPYARAVRAITIDAPADAIWPWIMQIGRDRGGFYSYTWLENLVGADIHNIDHLMPGSPDRQPGDTVWMAPPEKFGGMGRMMVASVIPQRAMVLVPPGDADPARSRPAEGAWSFILDPVSDRATRLVMLSLAARPRLADLIFWEPAHFVMERKMMRTLKSLAERDSWPSAEPRPPSGRQSGAQPIRRRRP
jgi:hypothetical protein